MDDVEYNKDIVRQFIRSMSSIDLDMSVLGEDLQWWIPGSGHIGLSQFLELRKGFEGLTTAPMKLTVTAFTAEDDRIAVEASGSVELKDGRLYENTYHFLFRIRDGLIREVREHNNSAAAAAIFGDALTSAT
jgi:ketosteroid isomerase-like protein